MGRFFVGANAFENSSIPKKDFRIEIVLYQIIESIFIFKKKSFPFLLSLLINLKFLNLEIFFL